MTKQEKTMTKKERFAIFIKRLKDSSQKVNNRNEAFDLIKTTLDTIENENTPYPANDYVDRMHAFPILLDYGWENIDSDPCYWIDSVAKHHKLEIYNSGRIVITDLRANKIILDRP